MLSAAVASCLLQKLSQEIQCSTMPICTIFPSSLRPQQFGSREPVQSVAQHVRRRTGAISWVTCLGAPCGSWMDGTRSSNKQLARFDERQHQDKPGKMSRRVEGQGDRFCVHQIPLGQRAAEPRGLLERSHPPRNARGPRQDGCGTLPWTPSEPLQWRPSAIAADVRIRAGACSRTAAGIAAAAGCARAKATLGRRGMGAADIRKALLSLPSA